MSQRKSSIGLRFKQKYEDREERLLDQLILQGRVKHNLQEKQQIVSRIKASRMAGRVRLVRPTA